MHQSHEEGGVRHRLASHAAKLGLYIQVHAVLHACAHIQKSEHMDMHVCV